MFYPISYRYFIIISVLIGRVDVWKALLNVNEEVLKKQGLFNTKSIVAEFFNQAIDEHDDEDELEVFLIIIVIMLGNPYLHSISLQSLATFRDLILYVSLS